MSSQIRTLWRGNAWATAKIFSNHRTVRNTRQTQPILSNHKFQDFTMPQNAPSSRHIVYQRFRLSTPMLAFLGLFGSAAITLQILPTLISILLALFELLLISSVSFFQQPWFSIPLIYIAYTLYQTDKKPESRSFRNLSPCIQELHKERRQFHEETTALLKALRDTGCDKDVYRHLEDVTVLSKNMATLIEDFMEVQTAVVCSMKVKY